MLVLWVVSSDMPVHDRSHLVFQPTLQMAQTLSVVSFVKHNLGDQSDNGFFFSRITTCLNLFFGRERSTD